MARHAMATGPTRLATVSPDVASRRERGLFILAGLALAAFAVLFSLVRRNRTADVDLAVTRKLQKRNEPWFDRLMRFVSWFGFPPQSRIIPPALAASIVAAGHPLEGVFQFLAWGTGFFSFLVKRTVRRKRPSPTAVKVAAARISGSSFPSGHVINYVGVYGFLLFLVRTWVRPTALRRLLVGFLGGLLALVGPSRIYLGHHWLTDTLASYLLGMAYLIGLTAIYRRVRRWWDQGNDSYAARDSLAQGIDRTATMP